MSTFLRWCGIPSGISMLAAVLNAVLREARRDRCVTQTSCSINHAYELTPSHAAISFLWRKHGERCGEPADAHPALASVAVDGQENPISVFLGTKIFTVGAK